jgi:hypothetical protein
MPAAYRLDLQQGIVLSKAVGRLTSADLLAHHERLRVDPAFRPTYRQLWDLTAVTDVAVPTETVWALARDPIFEPGVRRAIVAPANSAVIYGLARMFATLRELQGERIMVFRTLPAAWTWLDGIEEPSAASSAPS